MCIGADEPEVVYCGNGIIQEGEECDDCNNTDWDGCNSCAIKEIMVDTLPDDFYRVSTTAVDSAQNGIFTVAFATFKEVFYRQFDELGLPLGTTSKANTTYGDSSQDLLPAVEQTMDKLIIAWGEGRFMDTGDVHARVFSTYGQPIGNEFMVNMSGHGTWFRPALSKRGDGGFTIAWHDESLFARHYGEDGQPMDLEFPLCNSPYSTSVDIDMSGNFLVIWADDGISAQRYSSDGTPEGDLFQVNSANLIGGSVYTHVARAKDGSFVVVWNEFFSQPDSCIIFARTFGADGVAYGDQFRVNSNGIQSICYPSVAAGDDGRFIVAWGTDTEVAVRYYDVGGIPTGEEFTISTFDLSTGTYFIKSAASMEHDGRSVVSWARTGFYGNVSQVHVVAFTQRIDSKGNPLGTLPWDHYQKKEE